MADDADREIRIFLSSPFKDMQKERDAIVRTVIPKLRKICTERDVLITCIDLRWYLHLTFILKYESCSSPQRLPTHRGVTELQSEQGATVLMCLREVDKANVFVGLYGERYASPPAAHLSC